MKTWLGNNWFRIGCIAALTVISTALGDITIPQPGTAVTGFSNTCFTTKQCAATSLIDKTGTDIATQSNPLTVGDAGHVVNTPTTTATQAYAAGNCIAGFQSITVADQNGGSGYITNFSVQSASGLTPTIIVFLFDSNPSASTCTDHGTFTLASADYGKLITAPKTVTLASPTGLSAQTWGGLDAGLSPPRPFIAGGSHGSGVKTIYYALVTGTGFTTPGNTTDISTNTGFALN